MKRTLFLTTLLLSLLLLNCSDSDSSTGVNDTEETTTEQETADETSDKDSTDSSETTEEDTVVVINEWLEIEGDGSESNPYQIKTLNQLDSVRHHSDKNYLLMNDLDMDGSVYDSI